MTDFFIINTFCNKNSTDIYNTTNFTCVQYNVMIFRDLSVTERVRTALAFVRTICMCNMHKY